MVGTAIFMVLCVAMGIVFIWDLGGFATLMRKRLEAERFNGPAMRRMPTWAFRAFGVWAVLVGIGSFVYLNFW